MNHGSAASAIIVIAFTPSRGHVRIGVWWTVKGRFSTGSCSDGCREHIARVILWAASVVRVGVATLTRRLAHWLYLTRAPHSHVTSSLRFSQSKPTNGVGRRGWVLPQESRVPYVCQLHPLAPEEPEGERQQLLGPAPRIGGTSSGQVATTITCDRGRINPPTNVTSVFPATGALPVVAAFCNPFRGGLSEIVLARQQGTFAEVVHFFREPYRRSWARQIVVESPTSVAYIVITAHQGGAVQAYWADQAGFLWRSWLTPHGFSAPTALAWAEDTRVLKCTYYVPDRGGVAESVLYGITRDRGPASSRWIRRLHAPLPYSDLPGLLHEGHEFKFSMTGNQAWAVDAVYGGYLRRWDGQAGGKINGALTYAMAGVEAQRVFGTSGRPQPHFPQPLFVARDGLAYLWNSRTGPLPCAAVRREVMHADTGRPPYDGALVYLSSADGRVSVIRKTACNPRDPRWSPWHVIVSEFDTSARRLVPVAHPEAPPALFIVSAEDLTLFTPERSSLVGTAAPHTGPWKMTTAEIASPASGRPIRPGLSPDQPVARCAAMPTMGKKDISRCLAVKPLRPEWRGRPDVRRTAFCA